LDVSNNAARKLCYSIFKNSFRQQVLNFFLNNSKKGKKIIVFVKIAGFQAIFSEKHEKNQSVTSVA